VSKFEEENEQTLGKVCNLTLFLLNIKLISENIHFTFIKDLRVAEKKILFLFLFFSLEQRQNR
jgi:hypothetical protein